LLQLSPNICRKRVIPALESHFFSDNEIINFDNPFEPERLVH
jgi:hypothetical protein